MALSHRVSLAGVFAWIILMAVPALADEVTGRVMTAAAAPVPYARVILFDPTLSLWAEARASWRGEYRLEAPPGTYRLAASARDLAYAEVPLALAGSVVQDFVLGAEVDPGTWSLVGDTSPEELAASNSGSLLADGSLLFCHDTREPVRFDPVQLLKTFPPDSNDYQGCSALTLLGNGELLFVGGQKSDAFTDSTDRVKGFDTWTGTWSIKPSLNVERWYPSLARLSDESLLVCGGGLRPNAARTDTCEVRDPLTGAWSMVAPMSQPSEYSPMALLHTGEVLKNWFPPQLYDPSARSWRSTGTFVQAADRGSLYPDHCDHSMTVLRNGEALIAGILPQPSTSDPMMAEHYDPCAGTWSAGGDGGVIARSRIEMTPLPDGRVLVVAGKLEQTAPGVFVNAWGYTRLADLYDPARRAWRAVAEMRVAREYHATTLLLPAGRVLTTGGTGAPGQSGSPDMGIDVFAPPYLARGPRPRIDVPPPAAAESGQWIGLDVSLAPAITSVILIGTQAATHYVDGAIPRRLALPFRQSASRVEARVPASPIAAPAGWYLLFAMVDDVPSEGRLLRVVPATSSVPDDSVGNTLRVVRAGTDAVLDWRRGPLNPSNYNLIRATAKEDVAFTPAGVGAQFPVARPDEESWRDPGAVVSAQPIYFYQALGRNCDGTTRWP